MDEWYNIHIKDSILTKVSEFEDCQSGWRLVKISHLEIQTIKFNPLRSGSGGAYFKLPDFIARKRAVINILSNHEDCFALSIISAIFPAEYSENLPSSYPDYREHLNFDGISFPVTLRDIPKFSKLNKISVNVIVFEKGEILVAHLPKIELDIHVNVNLLLLENEDGVSHYCYIKDLSAVLGAQCSKNTKKKFFCCFCLNYWSSQAYLDAHKIDCLKMNNCKIELPSEEEKIIKFNSYYKKEKLPFSIYADCESLLGDVKSSLAPVSAVKQHFIHSLGYLLHCSYDDTLTRYAYMRGEGCGLWFARELFKIANDVQKVFINLLIHLFIYFYLIFITFL